MKLYKNCKKCRRSYHKSLGEFYQIPNDLEHFHDFLKFSPKTQYITEVTKKNFSSKLNYYCKMLFRWNIRFHKGINYILTAETGKKSFIKFFQFVWQFSFGWYYIDQFRICSFTFRNKNQMTAKATVPSTNSSFHTKTSFFFC